MKASKYFGAIGAMILLTVTFMVLNDNDKVSLAGSSKYEKSRDTASVDKPGAAQKTKNSKPKNKTLDEQVVEDSSLAKNITPAIDQKDALKLISELNVLKGCYESGDCDFPETDPKSYHFAVGKEMRVKILRLKSVVESEGLMSVELEKLGQKFLSQPNGEVKSAALQLLATQEKSADSMQAILDEVIGYHESELVVHAMLELQRYIGDGQDVVIHKALTEAMATGAPFVSQEISKNIGLFVTGKSFNYYRQGLRKVLAGTLTYEYLEAVLSEYKKINESA